MATFKEDKYIRLVYCLANGCTKVAKSLVLHYVKLAKPADVSEEDWTLDDFLHRHRREKTLGHLKKEQDDVLFPGHKKETNIDHWDLALLFTVLRMCKVDQSVKDDLFHIKKIRNKLFHMGTTVITDAKFSYYKEKIEKYVTNCCKVLNDDSVEREIKETFSSAEKPELHDKGTEILKTDFDEWCKFDLILDKLDSLSTEMKVALSKIDDLYTLITTKFDKLFNILLPNPSVGLQVQNCSRDQTSTISDQLYNQISGNVSHEEANAELGHAVSEAIGELLTNGKMLVDTKTGCVILTIKCSTFDSLKSFLTDCVDGNLRPMFRKVEKILRQQHSSDELSLDLVITHFEFWRCIEKLVRGMAVVLYNEIGVEITPELNPVIEAHPPTPVTDDQGIESGASEIKLTVRPTAFSHVMNVWDAIKSGRFDEKLGNVSKLLVEMYDLADLSITSHMEDFEELEELRMATSSSYVTTEETSFCDPCHVIKHVVSEAKYSCEDCGQELCETCLEHHKQTLSTLNHTIIELQDGKKSDFQVGGRRSYGVEDTQIEITGPRPDQVPIIEKEESRGGRTIDLGSDLKDTSLSPVLSFEPSTSSKGQVYTTLKFKKGLNVSLDSDDGPCEIKGIVMVQDKIIITDNYNSKLKVFDSDYRFQFEYKCDNKPWDIDMLDNTTIVVSLYGRSMKVLSLGDTSMTELTEINTEYECVGVCCHNEKIYCVVGSKIVSETVTQVHVYTPDGTFRRRYEYLSDGEADCNQLYHIAFKPQTGILYITDWNKGVVAMSTSGDVICVMSPPQLQNPQGIAIDDHGHIYVCGVNSHNVIQMSADGNNPVEILSNNPRCYRAQCVKIYGNTLLLTRRGSDIVSIYELL